jgi:hypothetical protein
MNLECRIGMMNPGLDQYGSLPGLTEFIEQHFLAGSHSSIALACVGPRMIERPLPSDGPVSSLQLHNALAYLTVILFNLPVDRSRGLAFSSPIAPSIQYLHLELCSIAASQRRTILMRPVCLQPFLARAVPSSSVLSSGYEVVGQEPSRSTLHSRTRAWACLQSSTRHYFAHLYDHKPGGCRIWSAGLPL